uniref:Uncharacterized protein n=1 Tax=Solanum lycopersicum TaxID=4081 RepID=K4C702_SOLLC
MILESKKKVLNEVRAKIVRYHENRSEKLALL